jgi:hypothetical protein
MSAYFFLMPVSMFTSRTITGRMTSALIVRPGVRRRERQRAAALAGQAVDLSRALPRAAYRELAARLRHVADEERRRLAAELATHTAAGPASVHTAVLVSGREACVRLDFVDGWQLRVTGLSAADTRSMIEAARSGMRLTGVDVIEGLSLRVRVRWMVLERPGEAFVQLAALRGPSPSRT